MLKQKRGDWPLDYKPYVPKVHLFHDNSGERAKGKKWMKDTFCRSNSGNALTNNPGNVTCKRCLSRMAAMADKVPGVLRVDEFEAMSASIRETETEAEHWREDACRLAETLAFALKHLEDDRQHVIAIPGTQITVGQVVAGTLALHASVKAKHGGD